MKKFLGLIIVSALLWSCGSQFSRSKYDRHMWNRSNGKTEKELKSTPEESKTEVKHLPATSDKTDSKVAEETPAAKIQSPESTPAQDKIISQEISPTLYDEKTTKEKVTSLKEIQNNKRHFVKNAKHSAAKKLTGSDNDNLVNILMIVLLVILILVAFSILDTLLGGLLSTILGLLLLVILIYFILRLLGVV